MQGTRITITEPNGVQRSLALPAQGAVIGRTPDCDIIINYERASRHHAQISFDGQNYYVTDLESRNGTFLGQTKIPANIPQLWPANIPMRIGEILFLLDLPGYSTQEMEAAQAVSTETVSGYLPDEQAKPGRSWIKYLAGGIIGLVLLCGCLGLGAGAFYYFS